MRRRLKADDVAAEQAFEESAGYRPKFGETLAQESLFLTSVFLGLVLRKLAPLPCDRSW